MISGDIEGIAKSTEYDGGFGSSARMVLADLVAEGVATPETLAEYDRIAQKSQFDRQYTSKVEKVIKGQLKSMQPSRP